MPAIAFGMGEHFEELTSAEGWCNIAFTPSFNEWQGIRTVPLEIRDFQAGEGSTAGVILVRGPSSVVIGTETTDQALRTENYFSGIRNKLTSTVMYSVLLSSPRPKQTLLGMPTGDLLFGCGARVGMKATSLPVGWKPARRAASGRGRQCRCFPWHRRTCRRRRLPRRSPAEFCGRRSPGHPHRAGRHTPSSRFFGSGLVGSMRSVPLL